MLRPLTALATFALCCHATRLPAQQPAPPTALSASDIMARVAANQDRSEQARVHYVYLQHTRVASRSGRTVRCEETADFSVTPTAKGTEKKLLKLDGRLLMKGQYVQYNSIEATKPSAAPPGPRDQGNNNDKDNGADHDDLQVNLGDDTMDRDLVENLRKNLTSAPSKDGLGAELFPLTSKAQADDEFHLLGREPQNRHDTYHLSFAPRDKSDFGWKGEAWVDAASFEPVLVRTTLSRRIPLAVRALLGTSLPGLGFTIVYEPQRDGVWFPISFGTEFKLRVLFFLRRDITLSVANKDFERTHVSSKVIGAEVSTGNPQSNPKP